jgi:hypothetical protein
VPLIAVDLDAQIQEKFLRQFKALQMKDIHKYRVKEDRERTTEVHDKERREEKKKGIIPAYCRSEV